MGAICANKWAGTLAAWALPTLGHASLEHSQALSKSPHHRWLGCPAAEFDCAIGASSGDPLERARSVPNPAQTRCPPAHARSGALRRAVCVDGRRAYTRAGAEELKSVISGVSTMAAVIRSATLWRWAERHTGVTSMGYLALRRAAHSYSPSQ